MCFSAEASFAGALVLSLIGILNLRTVKEKRLIILACIPFLFAIQQIAEGLIWLNASRDNLEHYARIVETAKYWFLTIAFGVWPFWIPLSTFVLERNSLRRFALATILFVGVIFSLTMINLIYFSWQSSDITVSLSENNINYDYPFPYGWLIGAVYLFCTILPPLISSYPHMWMLGLANFLGFVAALAYFEASLTSVWCFFAAWVSLGIYFLIRYAKQKT